MSVGIDPKYLQATIYLYPSASAALDGVSVGGSGFILGVMSPDNSLICRYAVTNKHVIDGGCRVIRTNTPDGSLRIVETAPEAWTCALDEEHLRHCLFVVVKREGDQIVGVGAVKGQRPNYARTIAGRSGFEFDPQMHELGYVVVRASHRRRGLYELNLNGFVGPNT